MKRQYTNMLLDMIDKGEVNKRDLCKRLIMWMQEDEVKEFMEDYELVIVTELEA